MRYFPDFNLRIIASIFAVRKMVSDLTGTTKIVQSGLHDRVLTPEADGIFNKTRRGLHELGNSIHSHQQNAYDTYPQKKIKQLSGFYSRGIFITETNSRIYNDEQ